MTITYIFNHSKILILEKLTHANQTLNNPLNPKIKICSITILHHNLWNYGEKAYQIGTYLRKRRKKAYLGQNGGVRKRQRPGTGGGGGGVKGSEAGGTGRDRSKVKKK